MSATRPLSIAELLAGYRAGLFSPVEIVEPLLSAQRTRLERYEWVALLPEATVRQRAQALAALKADSLPLYGIPFAIKDNIDLVGVPTTAGCTGYAYTPDRSATVVERLIAAGAIAIGKPARARPGGPAATASMPGSSRGARARVPRSRSPPGR